MPATASTNMQMYEDLLSGHNLLDSLYTLPSLNGRFIARKSAAPAPILGETPIGVIISTSETLPARVLHDGAPGQLKLSGKRGIHLTGSGAPWAFPRSTMQGGTQMKPPGFTAENSLTKSEQHYTGLTAHGAAMATVLPQLICYWDGGNLICGEPPFGGGIGGGGGVSHVCVQCRAACFHKPVAQRAACLARCDDLFCP
jgi:hypothetical protein